MATATVNILPKSTVELEIVIPWMDIKSTYDKVLDQVVTEAELPGFRKGKAPKDLVEKNVDKTKIYEEVVKQVIPKVYADAVKQHDLKPIVSPRITIVEAKDGSDWKIKAALAQKPQVKLKNYKSAVAKAKGAKAKLWVPGQRDEKQDAGTKKQEREEELSRVLDALLGEAEMEMPDILVEEEVNRMLSRLIDQTQKLGLTVEQYLLAQGKTSDQLRAEYRQKAEETLKLDFILDAVAEDEQITISQEEIEKVIQSVKDTKEQEKARANSYYIASMLRQQKTLDSLMSPVV